MKTTRKIFAAVTVLVMLVVLLPFRSPASGKNPLQRGNLVVCGDDQILIFDGEQARRGVASLIWSWRASEAQGQLPDEYFRMLRSLDDCKPVRNNSQLLVTSSSGATLLLEVATKQILFYAKTPMAHSADLLPNGRIAVANSTHTAGNSLEVYDQQISEKILFKDTLYSGHGAVWVAQRQELFALGFDSLLVYECNQWQSEQPRLKKVRAYNLPDEGGHELSPVSSTQLLVTTHHQVWLFNMDNGSFIPFDPLKDRENIKSANYDATTESVIYTVAEESWWTHHIYGVNPDFRIEIPDIRAYKVRTVR